MGELIAGLVIGFIVAIIMMWSPLETGSEAQALLTACELSLPRDEVCELLAYPEGPVVIRGMYEEN